MERDKIKKLAVKLTNIRAELISTYPFFGRLLMRLPFGFAECGTAYTDMSRIVFDPAFASRLSDTELAFLVLHELMHCVLKHCIRSRGKLHMLYNVACDIVVNSVVLEALSLDDIEIDGENAMHIAPDGKEGRLYSAEEVYFMLLDKAEEKSETVEYGTGPDSHDIWQHIIDTSFAEDIWDQYIKEAAKVAGQNSGIPAALERIIEVVEHKPKISWQQVLHDYIQNTRSDYMFSPPDRRFSGDLLLPSFQQDIYGSKLENIWYIIDTSGSVSSVAIAEAFEEIKSAIDQIENVTGKISFFDSEVSAPVAFNSVDDVNKLKPIGGGGTSFAKIFKYMEDMQSDEFPKVIVIITDGYAPFPDESMTYGVPVIWLIVDSEVTPPWGEVVRIYTEK